MSTTFSLTPIQIRDKKIKDLESQLRNERNARRNDSEQFEYKCLQCKEKSGKEQSVVRMLQRSVISRTKAIVKLKEMNRSLIKRIAELEDKVAVLEGRIKKNSSNSSKPPSSDGFKKQRTFSTREKSGRKPGGQIGHICRTIKPDVEEMKVIDRKEGSCRCGGGIEFSDRYQSRRVVDIKVTLYVTEERAYSGKCKECGEPFQAKFSSGFSAPVKYGENINALVAMCNECGNVPDRKTAEIVSSLCGDKISMSAGTVVNIRTALANNLDGTVKTIKQKLAKSNVLNVDETGVRVNGKLNWVNIFSNDQYTLFEHSTKRGAHCYDKDGILAFYTGILVHDHFKAYYKNKVATHAECNQHILRYLKAVIEIQDRPWAKKMTEFLLDAKKLKSERIAACIKTLTPEEIDRQERRYIAILDEGDKEYQIAIEGKMNIRRFREERCLLVRLREYKNEHLRFLSDFNAPFGNNAAEQSAHFMKSKTRVAGGFRSGQGADNHMTIASVIASEKKQKKNLYSMIKDSFSGKPILIPDSSSSDDTACLDLQYFSSS